MSIEAYPSPNGVLTSLIWRKTMSGGETSLSGYDNASQALSYTPGQEQVYLNGILLVRGDDYTATNGTSITGLTALAASDFVQINCYNNFSVATTPATSITGTIANNQLANSAITINGSAISLGGSVTLAGDIESVTAGTGLTGGGSSGGVTLSIDSTVATLSGSQSLTNKTIVSPRLQLAFNAQTGTSYTLAIGDANNTLVTCSNSSAITVTVPPSVFSAGDQINIQQIGAGQVTFTQGAGVTITSTGATSSSPKLRVQYSSCTIICTSSNVFTVIGDIS